MKDFYLAAIIGFLSGLLLFFPLKNIGWNLKGIMLIGLAFGLALLAVLALAILKYLSRFWLVLGQFGKFAAVGVLNTLLDFGVLNILILITGIATGWFFSLFKALSFLIAVTNSYFWNKFWTFQSRRPTNSGEYARFVVFSLVSVLLNVGIASLIVNIIGAPAGFDAKIWANIGALVGTLVAFMWNFAVYKKFVFVEKQTQT